MPAGPTFENSFPEHFLVEPAHHRRVDNRIIPLAPHRPVAEENVKDCIVTVAMDRDRALGAGVHQPPNDPVDGWHASACRLHPRALRLVSLHRRAQATSSPLRAATNIWRLSSTQVGSSHHLQPARPRLARSGFLPLQGLDVWRSTAGSVSGIFVGGPRLPFALSPSTCRRRADAPARPTTTPVRRRCPGRPVPQRTDGTHSLSSQGVGQSRRSVLAGGIPRKRHERRKFRLLSFSCSWE